LISRLYKLKISQIEQKLIEKASIDREIDSIDNEIAINQNRINTATVEKLGSISDFMVLAMHKNTLKFHIQQLSQQKTTLQKQSETLSQEIIELQKESEQYKYILEEEKKEKQKRALSLEATEAEEFIQSKYIGAAS